MLVCRIDRWGFCDNSAVGKLNRWTFGRLLDSFRRHFFQTSRKFSDSSTDKVFLNVRTVMCDRLIKSPQLYVHNRQANMCVHAYMYMCTWVCLYVCILKPLISSEILPREIKFHFRNLNAVIKFHTVRNLAIKLAINSQFLNDKQAIISQRLKNYVYKTFWCGESLKLRFFNIVIYMIITK